MIQRPDDESVVILVNGEVIAHANHDEDGWSGVAAVVNTALGIAKATDMKVLEECTACKGGHPYEGSCTDCLGTGE